MSEVDYSAPLTLARAKAWAKTVKLPFKLKFHTIELSGPDSRTQGIGYVLVDIRTSKMPIFDAPYRKGTVSDDVRCEVGMPMEEFVKAVAVVCMGLLVHETMEAFSHGGREVFEPHGRHDVKSVIPLLDDIVRLDGKPFAQVRNFAPV